MRKVALLQQPVAEVVRLMIYEEEQGVYLFGYNTVADAGCAWDHWFQTVADAEEAALEEYGVPVTDWQPIVDPLPGCQHDWIAPVRVQGRSEGNPQWSCLEKLVDGQWLPFRRLS
ncbi:hypothetical protein DNI29_00605 [Hymenobacter sediminis]|uniref:hypothetical protein n=1 Tax=Hymenobacter sediminis TaxID=2218621 RepID=UPI000DA6C217|nr:hypothetical protein [Hymenobacter sediminis]RPD49337.1 hypothetical protein DNI29_00605 [Hymenobacter sediminis]